VKRFIHQHQDSITFTLNGFDRLRFRGAISLLTNGAGLRVYMERNGRSFGRAREHFGELTDAIKARGAELAERAGRRVVYLQSPSASKERVAKQILKEDGDSNGLICLLTCVEPCYSYSFRRTSDGVEWRRSLRQCLHQYFYLNHREFGFCHVRIQTWCPFTISVCINGREWLARQMDAAGLSYVRRENCFVSISDPVRAQQLSRNQLRRRWHVLLNQLCRRYHPAWDLLWLDGRCLDYYWTAMESEWATDIVFRSRRALDNVYGTLINYAIQRFDAATVMRFLGQRVPQHGEVDSRFLREVSSNCKRRPEGIRIRHWVGPNSVKMYNKQHQVLRVETTIRDPTLFKTVRAKTTEPEGGKRLLPLIKGVAGLKDRAVVSQASNERYLDSLADAAIPSRRLDDLLAPFTKRAFLDGRPARGLRLFGETDTRLLAALSDGKFAVNGFRNRDIRDRLHKDADSKSQKQLASRVTRQLRMLRAHQLIVKVEGTHRYRLTSKGQQLIAAVTAASNVSVDQLLAA